MSTGKLQEIYSENFYEEHSNERFNISEIIIPFSRLLTKYKSPDIYSGTEKIPFKERNPGYVRILRQEFIKKNTN